MEATCAFLCAICSFLPYKGIIASPNKDTFLLKFIRNFRCCHLSVSLGWSQWCIAKNGGGYTQRGVAKDLKVPCLFMITEVSIRCPKNPRRLVYVVYPRIPPNTPLDGRCRCRCTELSHDVDTVCLTSFTVLDIQTIKLS